MQYKQNYLGRQEKEKHKHVKHMAYTYTFIIRIVIIWHQKKALMTIFFTQINIIDQPSLVLVLP